MLQLVKRRLWHPSKTMTLETVGSYFLSERGVCLGVNGGESTSDEDQASSRANRESAFREAISRKSARSGARSVISSWR